MHSAQLHLECLEELYDSIIFISIMCAWSQQEVSWRRLWKSRTYMLSTDSTGEAHAVWAQKGGDMRKPAQASLAYAPNEHIS